MKFLINQFYFLHSNCRQTSDPRSGFATVEKDLPAGGLTPMLGNRKVSETSNFLCWNISML